MWRRSNNNVAINSIDNWAPHYGSTVTPNKVPFPFNGYDKVPDIVVILANVKPDSRVLDLGIGTSNLAAHFLQQGCNEWGVDFHPK